MEHGTQIPKTPPLLEELIGHRILMALILFAKDERLLTGRKVVFSPENEFLFIEDKVSFTYTKKNCTRSLRFKK